MEWPCFYEEGEKPRGGCDLALFPTAEETAQRKKEIAKRITDSMIARIAIVEHAGPWKRGQGAGGKIDCPVCGGKETLGYSRAGLNGHVWAKCSTDGCVCWME
jgi:hypothetical protein